MEIAFVELTGIVLFREEKHEGGVLSTRVYAMDTEGGTVIIRTRGTRNKKFGIGWIKNYLFKFFINKPSSNFSRLECVKLLIKEIKIKKVIWKFEISEKMYTEIMKCLEISRSIYDNKNSFR